MIKIGKYNWSRFETPKQTQLPGFTTIVVMTKSSEYGSLGPYVLKNDKGCLIENVWQGSKLYPRVPKVSIPYTVKDPRIVWTWPAEVHIDTAGNITEEYLRWRKALIENPEPVRYPVGREARKTCVCSLLDRGDDTFEILDYINARKKIYVREYTEAVRVTPAFKELKKRLTDGENLLIVEIDGPHYESMQYYMKKYPNISSDFISKENVVDCTVENLKILLNDAKHPFGHGYCLAAELAGITDVIVAD